VYGLVSKDEFDERVSQALASRTYAELALVTADIPAGLAAAPLTLSSAPAAANSRVLANRSPSDRAVTAAALFAGLAIIAAFCTGGTGGHLAALLALAATASGFVALFLVAAQIRNSQRDKRSGGQSPPPGVINTGRSAGRLPHTGQTRRQGPADTSRRHGLRPRLST
jgi:hypothetical protein